MGQAYSLSLQAHESQSPIYGRRGMPLVAVRARRRPARRGLRATAAAAGRALWRSCCLSCRRARASRARSPARRCCSGCSAPASATWVPGRSAAARRRRSTAHCSVVNARRWAEPTHQPTRPPSLRLPAPADARPDSRPLAPRPAARPAAKDGRGAAGGHGGGVGARRRHHLFRAQPELHAEQGQGGQRALHLPVRR